jgi:hypothetical protein
MYAAYAPTTTDGMWSPYRLPTTLLATTSAAARNDATDENIHNNMSINVL